MRKGAWNQKGGGHCHVCTSPGAQVPFTAFTLHYPHSISPWGPQLGGRDQGEDSGDRVCLAVNDWKH